MFKNLLASLIFFSQIATSQASVVGRVIDTDDKSPIEFATVAVFSAKDTTLIAGTITSDNGRFSLNRLPEGDFLLRISFTGYVSFHKDIEIANDGQPLDVGDIQLIKGVMLDEFQITEMFDPIVIRGDTVEFVADAFRPTEGSMLEELLKRLPGVEIERDGKITFNGKEVRQILVDGEEFFSTDPQVAAKNIPADFVERIQAFLKQSDEARFTGIDDGDEQMVLNIILKPEIKMGWFGRLRVGGGLDHSNNFRYANSANINSFRGRDRLMILGNFNNAGRASGDDDWVQTDDGDHFRIGGGWMGMTTLISPMVNFVKKFDDRWSLTGSYRYSNEDYKEEEDRFSEVFLPVGSQFNRTEANRHGLVQQHAFNSEIKYTPNERNEFTIRPSLTFSNNSWETISDFDLRDTLAIINKGRTESSSESSNHNLRLQLSYGHRFAKPRRTFRINVDGTLTERNSDAKNFTIRHFSEFSEFPSDTTNRQMISVGNTYLFSAGATYVEPLPRDFTLSFTYRVAGNENKNERSQYNFNPITEKFDQLDSVFSNNFGNSFFQQTLSAQIQRTTEKYTYSLGFNAMPSRTLSFVEGQPDISRDVFNLGPQASFRYNFTKQSNLNFRYNGTTNQPREFHLQQVPSNLNPSIVSLGNPELKPEFEHRIHLQFSHFSAENHSNIHTSFQIHATQNKIANVTLYNPDLFPSNIVLDSAIFRPGGRINTYANIIDDFDYSVWGHISYGRPFFERKLHVNVSIGINVRNSKNVIDESINVMNTLGISPGLRLMYREDRFNIGLNGGISPTNTTFSLQPERNDGFNRKHAGADFSLHIIKDKLTLTSDITYQTQTGMSAGFNPTSTIWNAQLSYNIGKTNNAQLLLRVVDILNNRQDTFRWTWDNSINDITYKNTLRRFFMVSFIYNKRQTM